MIRFFKSIINKFKKINKLLNYVDDKFLIEARYTLQGHRDSEIINLIREDRKFSEDLSYLKDNFQDDYIHKNSNYCIISPHFHEKTGIGNFSLNLYQSLQGKCDLIFCSKYSFRDYSFELLLKFIDEGKYDKIIVMIGNSNHFKNYFNILQNLCNFILKEKNLKKNYLKNLIVPYIHDSHLSNIVNQEGGYSSGKINEHNLYYDNLINIGLTNIITNNSSIKEYIDEVFQDKINSYEIFHPIFETKYKKNKEVFNKNKNLKIGITGGMSESKFANRLLSFLKNYSNSEKKVIEVFCIGYNSISFLKMNNFISDKFLKIFSTSPYNQEEFESCLLDIDMAIQLRHNKTFESSGAICQLISCDIPIIASNVSQNKIFENVISLIDNNSLENQLEKILNSFREISITEYDNIKIKYSPKEWIKKFNLITQFIDEDKNNDKFYKHI